MKIRSRKAKGRRLQNWVRDKLLSLFTNLSSDDISCAIMGESGVDIKLSPKAREIIPYSIECKNKETFKGIYDIMEQAKSNSIKNMTPLAVIKMNKVEPLVILDAEVFFKLVRGNG